MSELQDRKRRLENKIENFFGEGEQKHTGDRGYQDLLNDLDEVNEEIEESENEEE